MFQFDQQIHSFPPTRRGLQPINHFAPASTNFLNKLANIINLLPNPFESMNITDMAKTVNESPTNNGAAGSTTFVQVDSTCFRDLVQRLTSPSATQAQSHTLVKSLAHQKLHERRAKKQTSPNLVFAGSPPSSPISTRSNKRVSLTLELNPREEEKAIKEKRFYLHPSPRSKPRLAAEPELLSLFPLESPSATY